MRVPIRIKITKENRKLVDIVKGDVLIFPDREETVKIVDKQLGKIYAQRITGNIEERVLYELKKDEVGYILNQDSGGNVYKKLKIEKKKFFKIFSFVVLSIFLLSAVSAMTVYSDFSDSTQSKTITVGQSVSFNADFFSMNPPITSMKVQLFQGNSLISTFLNSNTASQTYSNTYTYTANTVGTFEIRIIGTDSVNTDSETLILTVNSPLPPSNHAPVITLLGSNPVTITLGNTYTDAGAIATDIEDGILTSSIAVSGVVNTNAVGTYTITYSVTDSDSNTATATRIVMVSQNSGGNHAPVITSNPVTSITEGNIYNYNVGATDADGDFLTYSLIQAPSWLTINPNSGLISGTAPQVSSNTDYTIEVEVSDENTGIDTQSYTLLVKNHVSGGASGGSLGFIESDIYYPNKYFDQFQVDNTENKAPYYTISNPKKTINLSTDTLLIIFLVTLITAFSIVLIGLAIFIARKPQRVQRQRVQELGPESYY